ncbi:MAG: hypothetical protein COV36_07055 [Alphaproteobacteria bacterium CG11_big_fil_rev_8_21_14_0_20_44_7]|nr:MAG: hypothetical protein COV36_07055 [Alphaproteobacteria bacterium CG11_big_fil_rev_8_21_14_0_20_44_7]
MKDEELRKRDVEYWLQIFAAEDGNPRINQSDYGEMQDSRPARKPLPKTTQKLTVGEINQMDKRSFEKMRKGQMPIEAKIDLHGHAAEEARFALYDFIEAAQITGKRCVLVITGKGSISGKAVIRSSLPDWLNDSLIRDKILSFSETQPRHGGAGAFYVMLRKN